jgi:hypothetical protein
MGHVWTVPWQELSDVAAALSALPPKVDIVSTTFKPISSLAKARVLSGSPPSPAIVDPDVAFLDPTQTPQLLQHRLYEGLCLGITFGKTHEDSNPLH